MLDLASHKLARRDVDKAKRAAKVDSKASSSLPLDRYGSRVLKLLLQYPKFFNVMISLVPISLCSLP